MIIPSILRHFSFGRPAITRNPWPCSVSLTGSLFCSQRLRVTQCSVLRSLPFSVYTVSLSELFQSQSLKYHFHVNDLQIQMCSPDLSSALHTCPNGHWLPVDIKECLKESPSYYVRRKPLSFSLSSLRMLLTEPSVFQGTAVPCGQLLRRRIIFESFLSLIPPPLPPPTLNPSGSPSGLISKTIQ